MHASLGSKRVAFMKSRTLYEIIRKAAMVGGCYNLPAKYFICQRAKVNPLKENTTCCSFLKISKQRSQNRLTYDSLWPPGSELSSSARGQAGHTHRVSTTPFYLEPNTPPSSRSLLTNEPFCMFIFISLAALMVRIFDH